MPDANPQDFQTELALLREQVTSELEAHRLEVAAAIERLASAHGSADSAGEVSAMRARALEWERRETELSRRIATREVEYQALRARMELDRYRLQSQVTELEKELTRREAEQVKVKALFNALMAEHAECCRPPVAPPPASQHDREYVEGLTRELEAARQEAATLRDALEHSVALKLARSLGWVLAPVRSVFGKRDGS